ncbi:cyclic nucleotide-binding domain-containing protein [bacterium]|nr:cyclic nucleotide-binding domain-containing protein [bacterium]
MASKERLRDFLIFKNFGDESLSRICSLLKEATFKEGEVIVDEKTSSTSIFLIFSGRVKIFRNLPGNVSFLSVLDPNDIFGEVSFIDKMARSASASSIGECKLGVLEFESFELLKKENPLFCVDFLVEIMKELTRKFRAISDGLDVKSTDYTINELIASAQQVKISTSSGTDYLCTIKYSDRTQTFPLIKIDVKGQIIIIPFFQVKSIVLPNKYGNF